MNFLLANLITQLLAYITPNLARLVAEAVLSVIERAIKDSETQTDDEKLLPILHAIREAIDLN